LEILVSDLRSTGVPKYSANTSRDSKAVRGHRCSQIVYHTDDPGDPMFVSDSNGSNARRIYVEKPGGHCHHPIWSRDGRFIYFVKGMPDYELDIWRIPAASSTSVAERITRHNARVGYPAWLDDRTLIYSATAEDGSGQWLYTLDVERRIPHRVSSGIREQYHSVAVSETLPRRILCTVATPSASLWKIPVSGRTEPETSAGRLAVQNARALGPRFVRDDLLFLSSRDGVDGIWIWDGSHARELWKGSDGGVLAPPSVSPDGNRICFSWRKHGRAYLSVMSTNGTDRRMLAQSLEVRSSPSWSPDGKMIAVAATENEGTRVYAVPVDGGSPVRLLDSPSYDPMWSPDGRYIVYSEPLQGPQLVLKAVTLQRAPVTLPSMIVTYTTATSYRFMPGENALIYMKDLAFRSRNFYRMDLDLASGREQQLTDLKPGYVINSFDISPDGQYIVFDRLRDHADIVLFELRR
jgi:Tol biopolymer transport system component